MTGYDKQWEQGVIHDHREEIKHRMGESIMDATNLVLVSFGYDPSKPEDKEKGIHELAPMIGEIAQALFLQRSSHLHFYEQKRRREDAEKILRKNNV